VVLEATGTENVLYTYGDDLLSQERNSTTNYYHYDGLGSTRALSDSSGSLTDSYDYTAFGELLTQSGSTENLYQYTGEQFDVELDQTYLRARYYDQGVGKFTQQDTWMGHDTNPITLNKYIYGNADPANWTDPSGHFGLASFSAASSIRTTLSNIQIETGLNIFSNALDPDSDNEQLTDSAFAIGAGIIATYGGIKAIKFLSQKHSKEFTKIPGRVLSRINLANCVSRAPMGRCKEGWEHVVFEHYSGKASKSQFLVSQEGLRIILQSKLVVGKIPKDLGGDRYLRIVKMNQNIGFDVKSGNKKTRYLSVITNNKGELLTATPGKIR